MPFEHLKFLFIAVTNILRSLINILRSHAYVLILQSYSVTIMKIQSCDYVALSLT